MRGILLFIVVLLVLFTFVHEEVGRYEAPLSWTLRAAGGTLAITAAFAIWMRALADESLKRQSQLVLPLLAGALLYSPNWAVAIALGAIAVALILRDWRSDPNAPSTDGKAEASDVEPRP